jgi:elongator complex protein 1
MTQPPPSPQQITTLACELSTVLTDQQRDYCSASQIQIDYLHDIPTAARLLCRGSYFAEALRLLSLYNLIPQIPDVINTALIEKSDEITKIMADCRLQLAVQVLEIKGLRVKKTKKPLTFFGSDTIIVREEYLVNSVRRLIKRVNDVHVEVDG